MFLPPVNLKFLVYQWDPRHLQGSRVAYIFVDIAKSGAFFLKSNHILCISIIMIIFILIMSDVHKELSNLRMKTQTESANIYIIN